MSRRVVSVSRCLFYTPEDAEDHDGRGERNEGNAVADGVAYLHLPEELALKGKEKNTASTQVKCDVCIAVCIETKSNKNR